MLFLLPKDAPAEEWDAADDFVEERGEGEDGHCKYEIHACRRHLDLCLKCSSDRGYDKVMQNVDAVA